MPQIAALARKMAAANPLWGAPRIHGELVKLGIDVAERTVYRLMPKRRPPALSDLADLSRQPCRRLRFNRLLHRAHRSPSHPIRAHRPGPPPPQGRAFQRD